MTVKKAGGKSLETQNHCALKLFAPKLIHESQNCSNLHSLPRILPEEDNHYSRSTMSSSEL